MRGLAVLIVLALAACAPLEPAPPPGGGGGTDAACAAEGGSMRPVCRRRTMQCVIAYADAGRACRDGDDCQGDCRTDPGRASGAPVTGQCQATSDPCGCFAIVEDGRAQAGLCVD